MINFFEREQNPIQPESGRGRLFLKDDKALYLEDDTGQVTKLAGQGTMTQVDTQDTDTISLGGLGTMASPLTANALISSITSNALGITTSGGGGMYVADLSSAIATLSINKLDKVDATPQSVESPVTLKQGLILGDDKWINPETPQAPMYLTLGANPSGSNTTVQMNPDSMVLTSGDGTTQNGFMSFGLNGFIFNDPSSHYEFTNLSDETPVKALGRNTSNKLVEFTPAEDTVTTADTNSIDLSGDGSSGSPLTADVKLNSNPDNLTTETGSGLLTQVNWGDINGSLSNQTDLNTALDNKLDKIDATAQSVVSEVDFQGGVEVSGALASGLNVKLPSTSYIGNGTNPSNGSRVLFDTNIEIRDSTLLNKISSTTNDWEYTANGGEHNFNNAIDAKGGLDVTGALASGNNIDVPNGGKIGNPSSSNYVEINPSSASLNSQFGLIEANTGAVSLKYVDDNSRILFSNTYMIIDNEDDIKITGGKGSANEQSIELFGNGANRIGFNSSAYAFSSVPTDTLAYTYGQNASGDLVKSLGGGGGSQDLQSVTDEGASTTNSMDIVDGIMSVKPPYTVGNYYNAFRAIPSNGDSHNYAGMFFGSISENKSLIANGCKYNYSFKLKPAGTEANALLMDEDVYKFYADRNLTSNLDYAPTLRFDISSLKAESYVDFTATRVIQGVTDDGITGVQGTSGKFGTGTADINYALNVFGGIFADGTAPSYFKRTGGSAVALFDRTGTCNIAKFLQNGVDKAIITEAGSYETSGVVQAGTTSEAVAISNNLIEFKKDGVNYIDYLSSGLSSGLAIGDGSTETTMFLSSAKKATFYGEVEVRDIPTGTQVGLVGYDSNGKLIQGSASGGGGLKYFSTFNVANITQGSALSGTYFAVKFVPTADIAVTQFEYYVTSASAGKTVLCGVYNEAGDTLLGESSGNADSIGLTETTAITAFTLTGGEVYWISILEGSGTPNFGTKVQYADSNLARSAYVSGTPTGMPSSITAGTATTTSAYIGVKA